MDRTWPEEALTFAATVRDALDRAGGVDLARRAEASPATRAATVRPLLDGLGLTGLNPLTGAIEAMAAALAVRAAGAVVCPWPLAPTMAGAATGGVADALYLTASGLGRAEHLDLVTSPVRLDLRTGTATALQARGPLEPMPLDPFGVSCAAGSTLACDTNLDAAVGVHMVMTGFWVLGALDAVTRMAISYARERRQFGRLIGDFGAIQWRLVDIRVARDGLAELAACTLWMLSERRVRRGDLLALRLATLDAAGTALTQAHQVFASIGLCEEHDLAVIDRHLQPALRRPSDLTATAALLGDVIGREGFDGLFPIEPPRLAMSAAENEGTNASAHLKAVR
jgi:hypothetical protein